MFVDAGLSPAEISALFIVWSVTSSLLEIPSGLWADTVSRRLLLMIGPALAALGFALWTFKPCFAAFAAGFVFWGAGSALRSGTLQAVVYTELTRLDAVAAYPRLIGRSRSFASAAVLVATGLASPVIAIGGYRAVGIASVAVVLLGVPLGASLPDSRGHLDGPDYLDGPDHCKDDHSGGGEFGPDGRSGRTARAARAGERGETGSGRPGDRNGGDRNGDAGTGRGFAAVWRTGLAEAGRVPAVRRALVVVAVVTGFTALDEYVPLLVASTGAPAAEVALWVLLVSAGGLVGGWFTGRGRRGCRCCLRPRRSA